MSALTHGQTRFWFVDKSQSDYFVQQTQPIIIEGFNI